jgi:hypothetical protein
MGQIYMDSDRSADCTDVASRMSWQSPMLCTYDSRANEERRGAGCMSHEKCQGIEFWVPSEDRIRVS